MRYLVFGNMGMEGAWMAEARLSGEATEELTGHRPTLGALTGIRFFAAFYVVVFHTRTAEVFLSHGYWVPGNFFKSGYLAVPLFFLLSGFILAYTYAGQMMGTGAPQRFWEARFARIWPVYALSLLLSSVPSFRFPAFGAALATLCMVQAWNPWNPGMAGTWNFVCWTLSVEALFYLCFPWVQRRVERWGKQEQLWWIAGMLAVCVGVNSSSRTPGYVAEGLYRWIPLPVLHLPEFLVGVGVGNYYLKRLPGTWTGARVLRGGGGWTYAAGVATVALLCLPASRWTSVVVLAFAALLYGLAAESTLVSRFLSTRAMLLGGGISYSIYLTQLVVKGWVLRLTEWAGVRSETVRFAVTSAALIGMSLLLFKAIEEPARRVLRASFARLNRRQAPRASSTLIRREGER